MEDHCSTYNPALDWDSTATAETCLAQVRLGPWSPPYTPISLDPIRPRDRSQANRCLQPEAGPIAPRWCLSQPQPLPQPQPPTQVNTLAGFLNRKRPQPRLAESERYYLTAILLLGGWRRCTPLSYLTELYVQVILLTTAHSSHDYKPS